MPNKNRRSLVDILPPDSRVRANLAEDFFDEFSDAKPEIEEATHLRAVEGSDLDKGGSFGVFPVSSCRQLGSKGSPGLDGTMGVVVMVRGRYGAGGVWLSSNDARLLIVALARAVADEAAICESAS